jgi:hypothetical protein
MLKQILQVGMYINQIALTSGNIVGRNAGLWG